MLPNFAKAAAKNHVTRTHPGWVRKYGKQTWIDPGNPNARRAVLEEIAEVVRRYDVDGVHIDDYFYPYRESRNVVVKRKGKNVHVRRDIQFPDNTTWRAYGVKNGWTDRNDWRRDNVNVFVKELYATVKKAKPWVVVGVSPFGIWRSGTPEGVTGLDAYGEIYADSRLWLREGWLDYLAPQLYWPLEGDQRRFTNLDRWWETQNPKQRFIWPGLATFLHEQPGWPTDEIPSQITAVRNSRSASGSPPGIVHFRMHSLLQGSRNLADRLRGDVYATPAIVPAFPWLAGEAPAAPKVAISQPAQASPMVELIPGDSTPVRWWVVQSLRGDGTWTTIVKRAHSGPHPTLSIDTTNTSRIAVRALGPAGRESPPVLIGR
jgi:uncharacterized lipoprotein YddW (UPF0748 family)